MRGLVVSVWFKSNIEKEVTSLRKGQTIEVRGKVDGGSVVKEKGEVYFQLVDCNIVVRKSDPKPKNHSGIENVADRKAVFAKIAGAVANVEAACLAKFGKTDTIPAKVFLDREIPKALDALAKELGRDRAMIDAIRKEGDTNSWPKK